MSKPKTSDEMLDAVKKTLMYQMAARRPDRCVEISYGWDAYDDLYQGGDSNHHKMLKLACNYCHQHSYGDNCTQCGAPRD